MKIAYFSPLNPIKSGISDFSEELLLCLKEYVDIDLFTDNYLPSNPPIRESFPVLPIKDYEKDAVRGKYDVAVFHVGNNLEFHKNIIETFMKYGGILELHDISLHNYIAKDTLESNNPEEYLRLMSYCHGRKGKKAAERYLEGNISAPWETHPLEFTINKHLIDHAHALIVHSDFAKQMVKAVAPKKRVVCIPLHTPDIMNDSISYSRACKESLGIFDTKYVFGSFGYATASKRILQILEALSDVKEQLEGRFHYYIVGKVSGIDVDGRILELGLKKNVTVTGYVSLEELKTYMGACDICFNLRYPTHGESSASLHRMLGMGKPIIATRIGTFEEYPDDIVIKVRYDEHEVEDIYDAICQLTQGKEELQDRGNQALAYAKKYCDLEVNAQKYAAFFKEIKDNTYQDDYMDVFIDRLFEFGLTEDDYIKHVTYKMENLYMTGV